MALHFSLDTNKSSQLCIYAPKAHDQHAKGMAVHVSLGALCCAGADTVSRLRMVRGDGTVLAEMQALRCQRVPGLPP